MNSRLNKKVVLELNEAYAKTLHWFFSFPTREMSLNDLRDALGLSKTTTKRVVERLMHEGFLRREILGKLWRISCDQNHHYNFTRKICYNLTVLYESGVLNAIHDLIPNPHAVILFGSYRKGDDTEKSDIDIAVEVLGDDELKITELGVLNEFGNRKNVPVNLHIFSRNKINLNLFANIANGIVLEGFLEVRP